MLTNVELLGVNHASDNIDSAIGLTTGSNVLPWLQDTPQTNVWGLWNVTYRDVIILDSSNRVVSVLNLTSHDLGVATNKARLKEMLRFAANAGDTDNDRLPDHWEQLSFGSLAASPTEDPDRDGFENWLELALATDPSDPAAFPQVRFGLNATKQFRVTLDRWSGSAANYRVEMSTNLVQWSTATALLRSSSTNLFDGTGRSRTIYTLTRGTSTQPEGFVRINASPK